MPRSFKDFFSKARKNAAYWAELAVLDFTSALEARMDEKDVSRSELAKRLGTSQSYITKVLSGKTNFTINSMAALAHALGGKISIALGDQEALSSVVTATQTVVPSVRRGQLVLLSKIDTIEFELDTVEASNDRYMRLTA
jgi:transcriptional regulator with XRE-family HTH domain